MLPVSGSEPGGINRGEKLHFYAEPRNLAIPKNAKGEYEVALEVDIQVKPEKGDVQKVPKFLAMKIPFAKPSAPAH